MAAKKIVLKLFIEDEKSKSKSLKVVAGIPGVDSVAVDMGKGEMTLIGTADPVFLAGKLRKFGFGSAELQSVGPAKEEKKEEKKEENKPEPQQVVYLHSYYNHKPYEYTVVTDENPNACTIS